MSLMYQVILATLFFMVPSCAEDNTSKKKKSVNTLNNNYNQPNQQQFPNGQSGNQTGNPTVNNGGNIQFGEADGCGAKTFNKSLAGSLQKTFTIGIPIDVSGDGSLKVENNENSLVLDVGVENLSVSLNFLKPTVQTELDKAIGKRTFVKVSESEREALKSKGSQWASTNCLVGFAKIQKFPFQGKVVTVEFNPALPFAPFPDKVSQELEQAVGSGIEFQNIKGKITNIEGGSLQGFSVGSEYPGSVTLSRSGSTYKTEFNFGSAASLEKLGLFNFAAYTYSGGDISKVNVKVPVVNGSDSMEIEFR